MQTRLSLRQQVDANVSKSAELAAGVQPTGWRARAATAVVAALLVGGGTVADESARGRATPPTGEPPVVEVQDCLTKFPHRRRLASERSGILAEAPEEGDRFEPGAIVARLRDDVPRATLAVAQKKAASDAAIRKATKAHELADFSFQKMQAANAARPGTFDPDNVKQRELETATAAIEKDVAKDEFDVAQLEVHQHTAELRTYEIRSERGGVVTRVVKHDGEGVQLGEEVLEIVDTGVVRIEGYADGGMRAQLRPGLPVTVLVPVPGADGQNSAEVTLTGQLGFVDVSLTSGGEVRVWAEVTNPDHQLAEGAACRMVIAVTE